MVSAPAGVPGEGAGVAAIAVAPGMTGWARREPDSWQETVGADGEEGPGVKLDDSRTDLYVLEERTQSSRQSEHPFTVFSFLFVHFLYTPSIFPIPAAGLLLSNICAADFFFRHYNER